MTEAIKPNQNNLNAFELTADLNVPAKSGGTREIKAGATAKEAKLTVAQTAKYIGLGLIAPSTDVRKARAKVAANGSKAVEAMRAELDATNEALEAAETAKTAAEELLAKSKDGDALAKLQTELDEVKSELEETQEKLEAAEDVAAKAGDEIKRLESELAAATAAADDQQSD